MLSPTPMRRNPRSKKNVVEPPEIEHEALLNSKVGTAANLSPSNLFESFLVVGCEQPKQDAKVLFEFQNPSTQPPALPYLVQFCFPCGVKAPDQGYSLPPNVTLSAWHQNHPRNSVAFVISVNNENFYVICVYDDHLGPKNSFFNSNVSLPSSERNFKKSRCWCFISCYPFFEFFWNVLYHLLEMEEKLETSQNLTIKPNPILASLSGLLQVHMPKPGLAVEFPDINIKYTFPSGPSEASLLEMGTSSLFHFLNHEKVLILLSAVLLDQRILILSSNPRVLSSVIMALTVLVRPFISQAIIIPLLPESLFPKYLEVPLPFIFGFQNPLILEKMKFPLDLIVVDLDEGQLWPGDVPIPSLPQTEFLTTTLHSFGAELSSSAEVPYKLTEIQRTYVEAIRHTIHHIFSTYFSHFPRHCLTNIEEKKMTFLYDSFFASGEALSDLTFFKSFFETQVWKSYSSTRLKKEELKIVSRIPVNTNQPNPPVIQKSPRKELLKTPSKKIESAANSPVKPTPKKNNIDRKVFVAIDLGGSSSRSQTTSDSTESDISPSSSSEDLDKL